MKTVGLSSVTKENARFFLYSLLLFLVTSPINGFSYGWYAVVGGISFFILAYYLAREYESPLWRIVLFCLLGYLCLPLLLYLFSDFCTVNLVSISFVACNVLLGVWYGKTGSVWSILVTICGWLYFLFHGFIICLELFVEREVTLYELYIKPFYM